MLNYIEASVRRFTVHTSELMTKKLNFPRFEFHIIMYIEKYCVCIGSSTSESEMFVYYQ